MIQNDTSQWPSKFIEELNKRLSLLKNSEKEKNVKKKELVSVKRIADTLREVGKKENIEKKRKENIEKAKKFVKIVKKITINPDLDVRNETDWREPDWTNFLKIKDELDEILIKEIREELLGLVMCYFAGHTNHKNVLYYPKVFYILNGHYLEEVVYSMFIKTPKYQKAILIEEIVRENGIMDDCGCMVPNELSEILYLIDSFEMA